MNVWAVVLYALTVMSLLSVYTVGRKFGQRRIPFGTGVYVWSLALAAFFSFAIYRLVSQSDFSGAVTAGFLMALTVVVALVNDFRSWRSGGYRLTDRRRNVEMFAAGVNVVAVSLLAFA